MQVDSETQLQGEKPATAWTNFPAVELRQYGADLGLELRGGEERSEVIRRIRERQELLLELDREALIDIAEWGGGSFSGDAGKEELARAIVRIDKLNYEGLTHRGLAALARLREVPCGSSDEAGVIISRLRRHDGFWKRVKRRRRAWVGSLVDKLINPHPPADRNAPATRGPGNPDTKGPHEPLRKEIEDHGLVGGLAHRLRGAADDYVRLKLDEIEERIDAKLDQIDKRLAEWRDREVANRLKILRITLIFTVLVAVLSLGYNLLKARVAPPEASPPHQSSVKP